MDTLPTAFAAVREFCAAPAQPPGFPRPPRARTLPRYAADATNLHDAQIELPLRCVIRTEAQRERLWTLTGAGTALAAPGGDSMLVLASMGAQGTDNYGIAIDSVWIVADTATVSVTEWSAGCVGGAMMTYPAMALRLPSATFVRFHEIARFDNSCE